MAVSTPEDLYGLPLVRFVDERSQLAKQLRAQGEREQARQVGALKKPTVAAWAVNQLVRTQTKAIRELFEAGDALAEAQSSGRAGADRLRDAARRMRAALDELLGAAEGLLDDDGRGLAAQTVERVGETLRAAAIDKSAREQIEDACLTRELQASGLLGAVGVDPAPSAPQPPAQQDKPASKQASPAVAAAHEQAERALTELNAAQAGRDRAAEALEVAEREVELANSELEAAKSRLEETERQREAADAELQGAEEALVTARERAQEAQGQLQHARREGSDG